MGYLINSLDVMALRHNRQKRYVKIQPRFNSKYGSYYPDYSLWFSAQDDADNGIYLGSGILGGTTSNMSIAIPGDEVFHIQSDSPYPYSTYEVVYYADSPYTNFGPLYETTISCGVTLRFESPFSIMERDKPWVKYGISWSCYANLTHQESVIVLNGGIPEWSPWQTISNTPYYWFNTIEPQINEGFGPYYQSNSITIPAASNPPLPPPGEEYEGGEKRTRYLGSISVGNINTYRRGDYHHA